jgi:hypothetical protein
LLAEVLAAGGCLPVEDWRELTLRHGYKYANGFFGSQAPYMRKHGNLRCLTDRGRAVAL